MRTLVSLLALAPLLLPSSALAARVTFNLVMTGAQEAPAAGDPDGLATGLITLDDGSGEISWSFGYSNIDAPTLMHIHGPNAPAGVGAGVFIGLGVATSGGAGTLVSSLVHGSLAQVSQILAAPETFYVNIHNGPFPGGAVRGQIPEPETALLFGSGLAGIAFAGRRAHRWRSQS